MSMWLLRDLRTAKTVSDVTSSFDKSRHKTLETARVLLSEGRFDASLRVLKAVLLEDVENADAMQLLSELLVNMKEPEAADACAKLAEALFETEGIERSALTIDPETVFEAGYRMIDIRQYDLAVSLLDRCFEIAPEDATLNYELGFALMALQQHDRAVKHFEISRQSHDDFDTSLNLSVCYGLMRDLGMCRKIIARLEKLAKDEDEKLELAHRKVVLQRLDKLRWKPELTYRDWLYALYGTVVLRQDTDTTGGDTEPKTENYKSIAATMLVAKGVLEGLRHIPEVVEFYSPNSRPFAAVLARLLDVPLEGYKGPDRPDRALMVLDWANEIIGPHEAFSINSPNRSIFAYGLSKMDPLPVTPDMVAQFTFGIKLPWSYEDSSEPGLVDPESAIPEILERAWDLESNPDIVKAVHDTIEYYSDKHDSIVLGNTRFPQRPEFSAEVPLQKPAR